jgi:hypothetical protein
VGDWARVGKRASALASALVPGAPLLVRLRRAPGQHVARVTHDLGPAFSWEGRVGLGLVVPAEARSAWAERHPQAFGFLCAMEGVFGSWPAFREAGREVLLLGRLRPHDRAIPHGEAA